MTIIERFSGYWSFALAASAVPLSYLAVAPCGFICGSCPLGGTCFAATPLMFGAAIVLKFGQSVKWRVQSALARLTGRDLPPRPILYHQMIIDIEDMDDEDESPKTKGEE